MLVKHPWLRLAGIASSLADTRQLLRDTQPQLVLLDNYLPDGKGITLLDSPEIKSLQCSVIFITAASDMNTCSTAIRSGAFDYLLKPISWKRLDHTLPRLLSETYNCCLMMLNGSQPSPGSIRRPSKAECSSVTLMDLQKSLTIFVMRRMRSIVLCVTLGHKYSLFNS